MITSAAEVGPAHLASPETAQPTRLRLLSCGPANGRPVLAPYAHYLNHLLGGCLRHLVLPEQDALTAVQRAARRHDLVILDEPEQSLTAQLCHGRPGQKYAARIPASILIARQPLWPLHRLLLILRMDSSDKTAVFWAKRFAQAGKTAVTILPLIPALPAMYAPQSHGIANLLSSQTAVGQQLRQLAGQFNNMPGTIVFHLRQGEPVEQIRTEIETNLYDLVLIGAEPQSRWQHLLLGNLVTPLLSWITHPVLIARSSPGIANLI